MENTKTRISTGGYRFTTLFQKNKIKLLFEAGAWSATLGSTCGFLEQAHFQGGAAALACPGRTYKKSMKLQLCRAVEQISALLLPCMSFANFTVLKCLEADVSAAFRGSQPNIWPPMLCRSGSPDVTPGTDRSCVCQTAESHILVRAGATLPLMHEKCIYIAGF